MKRENLNKLREEKRKLEKQYADRLRILKSQNDEDLDSAKDDSKKAAL
jgi:hypothetical protein